MNKHDLQSITQKTTNPTKNRRWPRMYRKSEQFLLL